MEQRSRIARTIDPLRARIQKAISCERFSIEALDTKNLLSGDQFFNSEIYTESIALLSREATFVRLIIAINTRAILIKTLRRRRTSSRNFPR